MTVVHLPSLKRASSSSFFLLLLLLLLLLLHIQHAYLARLPCNGDEVNDLCNSVCKFKHDIPLPVPVKYLRYNHGVDLKHIQKKKRDWGKRLILAPTNSSTISFLDAFAKLQKTNMCFVLSVCLSALPSVCPPVRLFVIPSVRMEHLCFR